MSERSQPSLFDQPDPAALDQQARERVAADLDTTLFVEAGAGSGKTRSLVDRVESLLAAGVPMRHIAAITFTERAAAELRDRIRTRIIDRRDGGENATIWADALDDLDGAAVSTLHAFAQRLLGEHPIEAGLPPNVEVLDEISSQVEFDVRWRAMADRLFADPDLNRTLELSLALGVTTAQLRSVALEFTSNWDLVEAHPPGATDEPPAIPIEPLLDAFRALTAQRSNCLAERDQMTDKLDRMQELADRLERAGDDASVIELLLSKRAPTFKSRLGSGKNWPDGVLEHLRNDLFPAAEEAVDQTLDPIREACLQRLVHELARFVIDDAERRRTEGRLRFHDLLVHARRLLADPEHGPGVRAALSSRYQRLLLDEFQDTDPLQIELATLLAAPPDQPAAPWAEMDTRPGRLFFVGDPKQSIYRFRRADIALYLAAQHRHQGESPVELSRNFRSTRPILDWVNHTFGRLITHVDGCQPAYRPLQAVREAPAEGPGVVLLDGEHEGLKAAALREAEAASVATTIRSALDEGWTVGDEDGRSRPARPSDICVLLPARTSLPQLEAALTRAGVPFRVETSTLVYAAEDVRALMACLRALVDPGDTLSLATALRSPAFGCGDDDLFTWRVEHDGPWDHRADAPAGVPADHPVAESVAYLRALAADSRWLTPPQVIDRLIQDRRLLESAAFAPHASDRWRQLRFVADQSRAWADTHGGDLRDYLAWAQLQSSDSARVAEPVLDEPDAAAVRIMTIHASKGLEFPIAVLSGLTTRLGHGPRGPLVIFPSDGPAQVRLKADVATKDFERLQPVDEQMDEYERIRLLYVGCTRARDHLVVSCHRLADGPPTAARLLWDEGHDGGATTRTPPDRDRPVPTGPPEDPPPLRPQVKPTVPVARPDALDATRTRVAFETERLEMLQRAAAPASLSATAVAGRLGAAVPSPDEQPGWFKDPVDADLPSWQRGRDGAALGRAVHATLQDVDLASGADLADLARHHAAAEGIADDHAAVQDRARAALSAPSVREALTGDLWREIYVAAPAGRHLVEGYIDLLYRTEDGFVVVDYKTDAAADDAQRRQRAAGYRWQLATYAHAVQASTGIPVVRSVVCFLDSGGAHEVEIEELGAAMAEIGRLADSA